MVLASNYPGVKTLYSITALSRSFLKLAVKVMNLALPVGDTFCSRHDPIKIFRLLSCVWNVRPQIRSKLSTKHFQIVCFSSLLVAGAAGALAITAVAGYVLQSPTLGWTGGSGFRSGTGHGMSFG